MRGQVELGLGAITRDGAWQTVELVAAVGGGLRDRHLLLGDDERGLALERVDILDDLVGDGAITLALSG